MISKLAILLVMCVVTLCAKPKYIITNLGTLGGNRTDAYGINDAGDVVGFSYTAYGEAHAFRSSNGKLTDLGTMGGNYSRAWAINNSGKIVGEGSTFLGDIISRRH